MSLSFCCSGARELAMPLRMQGEYYSSKLRDDTYALICSRQEATGAAAHGLQHSVQAWEARVLEMSRTCKEGRNSRAPVRSRLPHIAGRVPLAASSDMPASLFSAARASGPACI